MMACVRGPAPALLAREGEQIARNYAERRQIDPRYRFQWPQRDGVPLFDVVRDALVVMTENHCSYCDGHPLGSTGIASVDHFRPKSWPEFHALVCTWANLFLCCTACNHAKRERWHEALLHPDAPDFHFERYFEYRAGSGTLQPASVASPDDQARARVTIEVLDLNRADACASRQRAARAMQRAAPDDPIDHGYRFLLPLCRDAG